LPLPIVRNLTRKADNLRLALSGYLFNNCKPTQTLLRPSADIYNKDG